MARTNRRNPRGIALAFTVIVMFVMVLMVGLSIDMAVVALAAHQLQNAGDAAALAGAQWVKQSTSEAIQRAYDTAKANYAINNDVDLEYSYDAGGTYTNDLDIVLGRYYGFRRLLGRPFEEYFIPDMVQPNAVMAVPRRTGSAPDGPISYIFGPMVGVGSGDVWRHAIALSKDNSGAGILIIDPTNPSFEMSGTMAIHCPGGDIQINSVHTNAVNWNGTKNISEENLDARQLNLTSQSIDPKLAEYSPIPYELDTEPIPDPLAGAPRPGTTGGSPGPAVYDSPIYSGTGATIQERRDPISENNWQVGQPTKVLQPGYYPAGFKISGGDWIAEPGVYILGGGANGQSGLVFEGGTMNAQYCQFYVDKSTPEMGSRYAQLQITGGTFNISPPGDNPANYSGGKPVVDGALGVSIWQADDNPTLAKITGSAGSTTVISGTVYFPRNRLEVAGTNLQIGNQLIAWQLDAGGTGEVWINYDGRNQGTPKLRSMIVE